MFAISLYPFSKTDKLVKRSSCDDGKGNFGINSFNFLAFVLLTYNVVANVNNNLNNNNNNKNDQNINAISQNSNNVATNTNVGNQIGVTVLPIPGKRGVTDVSPLDFSSLDDSPLVFLPL